MTLYLNHAGTSWPKPSSVRQAVSDTLNLAPEAWTEAFEAAHQAVALHLGIHDWLPTPGCTQALAVAIADVPWQPGDRALTSGMEHHALVRPLAKLHRVEVLPIGRDEGPLDLGELEAQLAAGGVRLVAVSMASNVTGELLPFEQIVTLAHRYGALCLLDGAQATGWLDLDLTTLEVDLFTFAGHKGPQGPYGIGGLYVRPGVFLDTPAAACDGESCHPGPSYCDTGSVDLPALVGLAAGLRWMADHRPLAGALRSEVAFREAVATHPRIRVVGGDGPRLPTCSLVIEGINAGDAAKALAAQGILARGGTHCAPRAHDTLGTGAAGTLRLSFGPGHTPDDAGRAAAAVNTIASG